MPFGLKRLSPDVAVFYPRTEYTTAAAVFASKQILPLSLQVFTAGPLVQNCFMEQPK
jgi:hypothetical protein